MNFEQVLQEEMQKQKERVKRERRASGQAGHLLLPLEHSRAIRDHIRAILQVSGDESVE